VGRGDQIDRTLALEISPINYGTKPACEWVKNPIAIGSADFSLKRRQPRNDIAEGERTKNHEGRYWAAAALIVVSAAALVLKETTAAAILLVGGLLLWLG
jgi:hypothetical protein